MFGRNSRGAVAGAGIALLMAVGTTACGGDTSVDKAAFTKKLKSEKQLKGEPDKVVDCIRDISLKYGDKSRINDYIDGKRKLSDGLELIKNKSDVEKATKELGRCAG
ncbi:MAG TPA: hypothetical protein VHC49_18840 [Mycobacteriales bacterium]|nr:hypothetical protein [Mycobacteriales bacterium]